MNIDIVKHLLGTINKYVFRWGYGTFILTITILFIIWVINFQRGYFLYTFIFRTYVEKARYKFIHAIRLAITFMLFIFLLIIMLRVETIQLKEYEGIEEYEVVLQIAKLDEMQNSLENLQSLISSQKERLINTEKYIELLKMEKQKLEPIVKANRELVESILTLQKERTMSQVWEDRFIGFVISVLAGLAILIFRNFLKSLKS